MYELVEKCFDIQNPYFLKMMALIAENQQFEKVVTTGRELHHVVFRSYFKKMNLPIDNSPDNLVSLKPRDHFLIHFYGWKCSKKIIRSSAACAFMMMCRTSLKGISDGTVQAYSQAYEDARKVIVSA
jgi:hypothetical protein